MAKNEKAAGKSSGGDKSKTSKTNDAPAFGVNELAKHMGIEPASVRVQLRNKQIERNGRSYGWNTKDEMVKVADRLRAGGTAEKGKAKVPAAGTKGATGKASTKKAA